MLPVFKHLWFAVPFLFLTFSVSAGDPKEIFMKTAEISGNKHYSAEMKVTTIRPEFTREISARYWHLNDTLSIISVTNPFRDKGMTFMIGNNEILYYVPLSRMLSRIPFDLMSQSCMGSDFVSFSLFAHISENAGKYSFELNGTDSFDGNDCKVITVNPVETDPNGLGSIKVWIAEDIHQCLKIEYYNRNGLINTIIRMSDLQIFEGNLLPLRIEVMSNAAGYKSIITLSDVRFGEKYDKTALYEEIPGEIIDLLPGKPDPDLFTINDMSTPF